MSDEEDLTTKLSALLVGVPKDATAINNESSDSQDVGGSEGNVGRDGKDAPMWLADSGSSNSAGNEPVISPKSAPNATVNEQIDHFYHFGKKIPVAKEDKVVEFLLRPDVYEASVLSLVETVLLTFNGTVVKKTATSIAAIELSTVPVAPASVSKCFVKVYMQVNPRMQRVVVVHVGPEVPTTASAKLTSALRSDAALIPNFYATLISQLEGALYGEGFALQYLLDITSHATNELDKLRSREKILANFADKKVESAPVPAPKPKKKRIKKKKLNPFDDSGSESDEEEHHDAVKPPADEEQPLEPLKKTFDFSGPSLVKDVGLRTESVVDPAYIRDLQLATYHNMNKRLSGEVEATEKQVKVLELQCARLMTVLKPNYQLCCLNMPSAPVIKPLTDYALNLQRKPIGEVNDETTRLLIFRARRSAKDVIGNATTALTAGVDLSGEPNAWICKLLDHARLLHSVIECVLIQLTEWDDEEGAERLRRKMLQLRERISSLEEFKLVMISTLHYRKVSETTTADRNAIASLQEKCRAITEKEPLLIELGATVGGRSGTLYITLNHIFFYSYGGIFLSIFVQLFQIALLVKITSADPATSLGNGVVILEDEGGGIINIEVSGLTADFHARIADFLNQLKQVYLF
jgi:hypothetical protein